VRVNANADGSVRHRIEEQEPQMAVSRTKQPEQIGGAMNLKLIAVLSIASLAIGCEPDGPVVAQQGVSRDHWHSHTCRDEMFAATVGTVHPASPDQH